jgi:hypothetical protein
LNYRIDRHRGAVIWSMSSPGAVLLAEIHRDSEAGADPASPLASP